MKQLILLAVGLLFFSIAGDAQSTRASGKPQVFQKEGFKIKCDCTLQSATDFIASAKKQGRVVIGAYACKENVGNAKKSVVIKVNVTDESAGYRNVRPDSIAIYNGKYMQYLAADMKKKGYTTTEVMVNGVPGLECKGTQSSIPTMLLILLRNKRIYTLSVSTKANLEKEFGKVVSSYQLL
jgi:hypothetical protein